MRVIPFFAGLCLGVAFSSFNVIDVSTFNFDFGSCGIKNDTTETSFVEGSDSLESKPNIDIGGTNMDTIEPNQQVSGHLNPFEAYSFCPPSPLDEVDLMADIIKDRVQTSGASRAELKDVFRISLDLVQSNAPYWMEQLKDSSKRITKDGIMVWVKTISNDFHAEKDSDAGLARSAIVDCLGKIVNDGSMEEFGSLSAGHFVACLHVLYQVIEELPERGTTQLNWFDAYSFCPPSPLADDDPIASEIKNEVRGSKASSAELKELFFKSLKLIQSTQAQYGEPLKTPTSIISKPGFFMCMSAISLGLPRGEGLNVAQDRLTIIGCFSAITKPFRSGDWVSAGRLVAYLDTIYRAIEDFDKPLESRTSPLRFDPFEIYSFCPPFSSFAEDDRIVLGIKEKVQNSSASGAELESTFVKGLELFKESRPDLMERLKVATNMIAASEILALMAVVSTGIPATKGFNTAYDRLTILDCIYVMSFAPSKSTEELPTSEFVGYLHVLYKAIEDRNEASEQKVSPPSQPGWFKAYSFCSPSPLGEFGSNIIESMKEITSKQGTSNTALKIAFLESLEMLKKQQSQFMDLLKKASNEIPRDRAIECIGVLRSNDNCSTTDDPRIVRANWMIYMCFKMVLDSSFELDGSLSAGQFVTYINALYKTIEDRNEAPKQEVSPPSQPGWFKAYSLCPPSPLNEDYSDIAEMIKGVMREPGVLGVELEHAFLVSLQVLKEQRSQFMGCLEDANKNILQEEATECVEVLRSNDNCSSMNDNGMILGCFKMALELPFQFRDSLSAGEFVAYLDVLYKAIEDVKELEGPPLLSGWFETYSFCSPSILADNDPAALEIKGEIKTSRASSAELKALLLKSLQQFQQWQAERGGLLENATNTISKRDLLPCTTSISRSIPIRKGSNVAQDRLTIVNCLVSIITTPFEASDSLSAGQLVAYLDVMYKAIEDFREPMELEGSISWPEMIKSYSLCTPSSLDEIGQIIAEMVGEEVNASEASREELKRAFSMCLRVLQERQSQFMHDLEDAANLISKDKAVECIGILEPSDDTNTTTEGLDVAKANFTVLDCFKKIFEMHFEFYDSDSLPVDQFVAYLHALCRNIESHD